MRSRPIKTAAIATLIGCSVPGTIIAQDAEWDLHSDPVQDVSVASVEYEGGALVAVQCQARELSVVFRGVAASQGTTRNVLIRRADGSTRETVLTAIEGSNLFTTRGAGDARFIRAGGQTTISSIPDDPRPFRLEVALPTLPTGVDSVLRYCGYHLSDDRDALPDSNNLLVRRPALEMPPFSRSYTVVRVEMSCLVSEGRLSACRSERETPTAPEVGAATARHADGRRLTFREGTEAEAEGGVIELVVTGNRIYR